MLKAKSTKDEIKVKNNVKPVSAIAMFRFATMGDLAIYFIGMISALACGSGNTLGFLILGNLFNTINDPNGNIGHEALNFVYLGIGVFVAAALQTLCFTVAAERMAIRVREEYLKSVLNQDITFFDTRNSGTLASSVAENSIIFREAIGEKLGTAVQFIGMMLSGLIIGLASVWDLALVVLAFVPVLGMIGAIFSRVIGGAPVKKQQAYAESGAVAEETISQIRTVAGLAIEDGRIKKFNEGLLKAESLGIYLARLQGVAAGSLFMVLYCCYAIGFYYGTLVLSNSRENAVNKFPLTNQSPPFCKVGGAVPDFCSITDNTGLVFESPTDVCACPACQCGCYAPDAPSNLCVEGGNVFTAFISIIMSAMAIGQAAPGLAAFGNGKVAAAAIYEIIDMKPTISNKDESFKRSAKSLKKGSFNQFDGTQSKKSQVLPNVYGEIKFDDVSFTYASRPDAPIFNGLNLLIPAGKTVALVGESGSGKSTIVSLIERFYDPTAGRISLDNVDIKDLDPKWYRSIFGYVGQEPTLFASSIKENILFGVDRTDVTQQDIEKAAKSANAHDFIMTFPNKYDTLVGGGGSQLSGGQKQRIAIARALIRDPKVLLLDEATSALDNESERTVQAAIDDMIQRERRTTVIVAHRLSTVKNADVIVVLGKGKVIEQGNHDELMASHGTYYALVSLAEKGGHGKHHGENEDGQPSASVTPVSGVNPSTDASEVEDDGFTQEDLNQRVANAGAVIAGKVEPIIESATLTQEAVTEPQEDVEKVNNEVKEVGVDIKDDGKKEEKAQEKGSEDAKSGDKKKKKKEKRQVPMRRIFVFAYPDRFWLIPAGIAALCSGAVFPLQAILMSNINSSFFQINTNAILAAGRFWALMFIALGGGAAIARLVQTSSFGVISSRMTTRIRNATFSHLIRNEIGYFDSPDNNVGVLTSKLASDAALVKATVTDTMGMTIMNFSTVVAGLIISFTASWKLSLVTLAMFPVLAMSAMIQVKALSGLDTKDRSSKEGSGQILSESIMGIRTVTALGLKDRVVELYTQSLSGPMRQAIKRGVISGLAFGLGQLVPALARALGFWYGGSLIRDDEITFQQFIQSFLGIMMMSVSIGQNAAANSDVSKGAPAVNSIFRIIDRKSAIDALSEEGKKPSQLVGDIEFTNISFAYPTRANMTILKDFNLKINRGETIALVGASGSGKSTIVLLLERFYDPINGTVTVDDMNVKDLNVRWLRSQMGYVGQEPQLFVGTIKENILNGRVDATDEEVFEAAKKSNAYDFIMAFPDKFDTVVGLKGTQLSGGQKQRIAIARAILRNPRILLLDEATSALDGESEAIVQAALDELLARERRTTIVVAHRLSTVKNADKIVVLDKGVVVETGTYDELLSKPGGSFAKLYAAQAKQR